MATLCRLRAIAGLQNFARISHFRSISSRCASFPVLHTSKQPVVQTTDLHQRIVELSRPVRHYGSGAEMNIDLIKERCMLVLKLFDKVNPEQVTLDARFVQDLGLDSLDAVEIIMAIEDEFGVEIPDEAAEKLLSLKDVVEFLADRLDIAE